MAVLFKDQHPSIQELFALRQCIPEFQYMEPAALRDSIGCVKRLDLGEFAGISVRPLLEKLERFGLSAVVRKTSFISYRPLNLSINSAMVVEDDNQAKELAERMIEEGIPVQDIAE